MPKLLLVVPIYGSYCAFLKGAAAWFSTRGWEVHVATNLGGKKVGKDVAIIHHVDIPRGANPLKLWRAGRALTVLIRLIQPSVVHAHFSVGMLVLALACRVKGVRRLGTFQGMRFPLANSYIRLIFMAVETFAILRLDQSWVLTSDDYDAVPVWARAKLAIQDGYGFGCDLEQYDPQRFTDSYKSQLRAKLGIPEDAFVFIFIGRLTAFKGFPLALRSFQLLQRDHNDVHFLVVGEPDSQHPLEIPDLNMLAGVHSVGWQDDPASYLAISNAMVFLSSREGMPVCVMEALSMGVFVIANDARGAGQLLRAFEVGRLLEVANHTAVSVVKDVLFEAIAANQSRYDSSKYRGQLSRQFFYETVLSHYV